MNSFVNTACFLAALSIVLLTSPNLKAQSPAPLKLDVLDTLEIDHSVYPNDADKGTDHFDDTLGVSIDDTPYANTQRTGGINAFALEKLLFGQLEVDVKFLPRESALRQMLTISNSGRADDLVAQWENDDERDKFGVIGGQMFAEKIDH